MRHPHLIALMLLVCLQSGAFSFRQKTSARVKCNNFGSRRSKKLAMTSTMPSPDLLTPFDINDVEIVHLDKEHRDSQKFYGSAITNSPTLVLNADYKPLSHFPLSVWHWQDSIRAVFAKKAVVVAEYELVIRSPSCEIQLPSVIALKQFRRNPEEAVPTMSRRKVFIRDGYKCQYCMKQFPSDQLSLDHVIPRSKGGKLIWTNTVTACLECNFRKGQYSLDEIKGLGMRLRNLPRMPSTHELQSKAKSFVKTKYHPDWLSYL